LWLKLNQRQVLVLSASLSSPRHQPNTAIPAKAGISTTLLISRDRFASPGPSGASLAQRNLCLKLNQRQVHAVSVSLSSPRHHPNTIIPAKAGISATPLISRDRFASPGSNRELFTQFHLLFFT
jgi:hypothetical protein